MTSPLSIARNEKNSGKAEALQGENAVERLSLVTDVSRVAVAQDLGTDTRIGIGPEHVTFAVQGVIPVGGNLRLALGARFRSRLSVTLPVEKDARTPRQ
jgi:hypothetical protein